jgi:hypothetical protein
MYALAACTDLLPTDENVKRARAFRIIRVFGGIKGANVRRKFVQYKIVRAILLLYQLSEVYLVGGGEFSTKRPSSRSI